MYHHHRHYRKREMSRLNEVVISRGQWTVLRPNLLRESQRVVLGHGCWLAQFVVQPQETWRSETAFKFAHYVYANSVEPSE